METRIPEAERIKHREISFAKLHPHPNQAQAAALLLMDVEGILRVEPSTPVLLHISYDVVEIRLQDIEDALTEAGFHLSSRLLLRLKRALYKFTEETLLANCGCPWGESNCTRQVFAKRYAKLDHSCRDHRPEHWRRYL